ncbi:endolytic transglycosylase MltG [Leptolyngbya sp. FACHB-261]|uniref:endolytic transglycosylase MltG n=1 Tax=Leptolyngbya sp. FACHB-261 TaxID=2692806 RepID=UPI00168A0626|nr:endolytic transglycosylase MltG [Leptolyngbya sp. FACHB-261]MBD2099408.1 endolytic transglycosylase MltG [Leptolyngbya sp. FACHB-261]
MSVSRVKTGPFFRFRWFFYGLLLPATLLFSSWQGWLWWSWATAPAQSSAASPVRFQVPPGSGTAAVGRQLAATGVIRSQLAWDLWLRLLALRQPSGSIQAGVYDLSPTAPLSDVAAKLWQGEVVPNEFTVPEGWSVRQMAESFQAQGYFSQEAFLDVALSPPTPELYAAYPWLPEGLDRLEGFLYPDTYQVSGEVTPEGVVRQMLDRFAQVGLPLYQKYTQAQGSEAMSLRDWVTLASIVEKEAVVPEERSVIAGVFHNRLVQGMTLGADPTVEYGFSVRQTPDKPLTLEQVQTANPYNTYLNVGLPPTPIASPGLPSLEATLYPQATEYLYFVARYDGTHVFSRTLQEHEAAQIAIRTAQDRKPTSVPPKRP